MKVGGYTYSLREVLVWKLKYCEENEVLPPHWVEFEFTRNQHGTFTTDNTTLTRTTLLSRHVITRLVHSPTCFFTLLAVYMSEHFLKKSTTNSFLCSIFLKTSQLSLPNPSLHQRQETWMRHWRTANLSSMNASRVMWIAISAEVFFHVGANESFFTLLDYWHTCLSSTSPH